MKFAYYFTLGMFDSGSTGFLYQKTTSTIRTVRTAENIQYIQNACMRVASIHINIVDAKTPIIAIACITLSTKEYTHTIVIAVSIKRNA